MQSLRFFASVVALWAVGCGGDRSAPPRVTIASPGPVEPDGAVDDAARATVDASVATPAPFEAEPLIPVRLVRFGSIAKACAAIMDRSQSAVLHNAHELMLTSVRAGCRVRAASPGARADGQREARVPSLVEFFRTTAFPRHSNVDSVAVAPAFPIGRTEWLVALESAEESEGLQNMRLGDAPGSVEVASVDRVDLVGTETPEIVFVLSVLEHPKRRLDLIACDATGEWCTKPAFLDRIAGERRGEDDRTLPASRAYAFRRYARGLSIVPSGEPREPERLFPLAPP